MNDVSTTTTQPRWRSHLGGLGLFLVALFSLVPLVGESLPVTFVAAPASALAAWGSKAVVVLVLFLAVAARVWADRRDEPRYWPLNVVLVVMAGLMTLWHACWVDQLH